MICPKCSSKLKSVRKEAGIFYMCFSCNGRAVSLPVVRKLVPPFVIKDLWQRTKSPGIEFKIKCPSCRHKMSNISLNLDTGEEHLDVCPTCQLIWFDPKEFERLPQKDKKNFQKEELPLEVRKSIALAKVQSLKDQQEFSDIGLSSPDHWWEIILGLFGVPVEYNAKALRNTPIATYLVSAAIVLTFLISFHNLDKIIQDWGLIPNNFSRHFGLTFISSFLLHGGIIHLLGNLYFLLIFGDNVEDALGIRCYLLLMALSAFAGDVAHILVDPTSTIPVIGASGGISGILVYYCLAFPRAKVGILFWFRWIRIPVGLMLVIWFFGQIAGALYQISGFSDVSSLAHLGGAAVGIVFWLAPKFLKRRQNSTIA